MRGVGRSQLRTGQERAGPLILVFDNEVAAPGLNAAGGAGRYALRSKRGLSRAKFASWMASPKPGASGTLHLPPAIR